MYFLKSTIRFPSGLSTIRKETGLGDAIRDHSWWAWREAHLTCSEEMGKLDQNLRDLHPPQRPLKSLAEGENELELKPVAGQNGQC